MLLIAGAALLVVMALRPSPVTVDVGRVVRGPLLVAIQESGTTRVKDRYLVSAPVSGDVSRLALDPGDVVKEGDTLVEVAPALSPLLDERTRASAEARLSAAQSALGQAQALKARASAARELAEQELARDRQLTEAGSLARQALEQAEFGARMRAEELASAVFAEKVAAEEVRVARVTLGRGAHGTTRDQHVDVIAPVSGLVLRVEQKSAGVVQAGAPLLEIGDAKVLEVVVDLLTTDAVQVATGTEVIIDGWGGGQLLHGRVRRIEPAAFTRRSALGVDEQRVNVIVSLTDPPAAWSALGDGYRVEARLVLWQSPDVVKLPLGAVFRHGNGWAAFRIDDGIARLTPVTVSHRGETEVEILSGLPVGTAVAVHPGDRVKDGVRVRVR